MSSFWDATSDAQPEPQGLWDSMPQNPSGSFWDKPDAPKPPSTLSPETTSPSPYFQGGGFGPSNIQDVSGKPFLWYENPDKGVSTLDKTRVDTTFDPRVAGKQDSFTTPRDVPNASALKSQMGGDSSTELDHATPLELAGSNDQSNLRIEPNVPGTRNTATDPIENSLRRDVTSGKSSLFDAQAANAKAKGLPAPYTGPGSQTPQPEGFWSRIGRGAQAVNTAVNSAFGNPLGDAAKKLAESGSSFINAVNQPVSSEGFPKVAAEAMRLFKASADVVFSPVTGAFSAASKIPVLNIGVNNVSKLFQVIDEKGQFIGGKIIDALPISPEAKGTLKEPFSQLLGLAGQIALGEVVHSTGEHLSDLQTKSAVEAKGGIVAGKTSPVTPEQTTAAQSYIQKVNDQVTAATADGSELTPEQAKGIAEDATTEVRVEQSQGTLSPTGSEAGFVNPSEAVSGIKENIDNVKSFLDESQKGQEASANVADDLYKVKTNNIADQIGARRVLESSNISPQDAEALYHYDENTKGETLTPDQKALYDKEILPLKQATEDLYQKLKPDIPLSEADHTPRFVQGKGGIFDRLKSGYQSITSGSLLSKTAGALKGRVMKSLVDEDGNRTVAAVKGDTVRIFENGNKAGEILKGGFHTNGDLLDKELKPLERQLKTVAEQKRDAIREQEVATRGAKSTGAANAKGTETQIGGMWDKTIAQLTDIQNQIDALRREGTLAERAAQKGTNIRPVNVEQNILDLTRKAQSLIDKTTAQEYKLSQTNDEAAPVRTRDVGGLDSKLQDTQRTILETLNNHSLEEPNQKVFVDSDGKIYNITDATTKEIEGATNLTYHKNILANYLQTYLKLRQIDRATQFLESYKESPEFSNVATKLGETNIPDGWKTTQLAQFRGYAFEPHVAAELDKFAGNMAHGSDPLAVLSGVNRFLRNAIFFNPLIHVPNIAVHWIVNRGLTPFLDPRQYKTLFETSARAINAVIHQNSDYTDMLREGGPLLSASLDNRELPQLLLSKLGKEFEQKPTLLKQMADSLGYANPARLVKAVYQFSNKVTWTVNDVATMQAVYEEIGKGKTMEEAITDVGKHVPNYRVPATVLGSEAVSKFITNPNLTMFGAYHYGALRSYGEMIKDLIKPEEGKETATRLATLDKMAMLGVISLVVYPILDTLAQKVTGNQNTTVGRAGAATLPQNLYKLSTGQQDLVAFLESIITPAAGSVEAGQLFFNRDLFTGNQIYNPEDLNKQPSKFASDIGGQVLKSVAPVQSFQRIQSGKISPQNFVLSLIRVSTPNHTNTENRIMSAIYDQRPSLETKIKTLYSQGNTDEANTIIKNYNRTLYDDVVKAAKENGYKVPSEEALDGALMRYYLFPPTQDTLATFQSKQQLPLLEKMFAQ